VGEQRVVVNHGVRVPPAPIPPELDSPGWVDEYGLSQDLHLECPVHLLGFWHVEGRYRHVRHPVRAGAVLCHHVANPPPEGAVPTDAQRRLDEALAAREAARKGAEGV
jgi:hypothetical protein